MVEFVLHHTGQITVNPFIVLRAVRFHPFGMNTRGALHLFMNAWQGKAAFLHIILGSLFVVFQDMRIDKYFLKTFVFRQILRNQIEVDNDQADILANLRSRQSDAFT